MFKYDFKYYKSRNPPPDEKYIIDFNNPTEIDLYKVKELKIVNNASQIFGIIPADQWKVYELIKNAGFIYIKNPFTSLGQRYWIARCLCDYTRKPSKLNIDYNENSEWNQDWWDYCLRNNDQKLLEKLRWVTFGYHHNWDTKVYTECSKCEFPADLGHLCKYLAELLKFDYFNAEAAIINYYHMDSTLSGHTDHSEQNKEAPLFSFSFGQSAIFLLGGSTLDIKPSALFLHSGDIVVMSKESRLSYHAVPKIISTKEDIWNVCDTSRNSKRYLTHFDNELIEKCNDENFWKPFSQYLSISRININVRQVLKEGQVQLIDN